MNSLPDPETPKPSRPRFHLLSRRSGRMYLALTAGLYLFTGLLAYDGNGFFAVLAWDSSLVIKPFPFLIILEQWFNTRTYSIHGFLYHSRFQPFEDSFVWFTWTVIAVSSVALWAAFRVGKHNLFANAIWFLLSVLAAPVALGNVAADLTGWGMHPYFGKISSQSYILLCLALSYSLAYLLALFGPDYSEHSATPPRPEYSIKS